MKKKSAIVAALGLSAALLVGGMQIGSAWSYFTDSSSASGGIRIKVGPDTDITEDFDENGKHVQIINEQVSVPVFVRVKVFANAKYLAEGGIAGQDWYDGGDGWWYYGRVVDPYNPDAERVPVHGITDPLDIKIVYPVADLQKEGELPTENFNVIVYYEATPDTYNEDGTAKNPQAADWALEFNDQEGE